MDANVFFNFSNSTLKRFVLSLHETAKTESQCLKVKVGAMVINHDGTGFDCCCGFNKCVPDNYCPTHGCYRKTVYGDDSKSHRGCGDCKAIHAEINALTECAKRGLSPQGATLIVTRYPCEECAKAIVKAGISRVVYARETEISPATAEMFREANIQVIHMLGLNLEDAESPATQRGDTVKNVMKKMAEMDKAEAEKKNPENQATPGQVLTAIREKYGDKAQICVCIEELNELACILAKFLRYDDEHKGKLELHDKVLDEVVDVHNILYHVESIFDFSPKELKDRADKKINRLRRWLKNDDSMQDTLNDRKLD